MRVIRRLPPAVADAIAAGEVVERPASVVKELCENALDAAATRVAVDVDGGGTVRIRVVDDGAGIAADQLPLAVARHATSKITAAADLAHVVTLGFRGEALASIAAVADVVLVSRSTGAGAAARLRVRGAEIIEQGPAAGAPGTTVEVRDLFATTPARLRFLRSRRTETAACVRTVADLAVTHPSVAFTCTVDGRVALRTPGGSLRDALRAILGAAAAAELVDVVAPGPVAVSGAVSEPRAHRGARDGLVLVVNGRRVHNRALVVAVEEAYRGLVPSGRHPYGAVVVDVDPEDVDVNVHPGKREVRFREEGRVFAAVQRACWAAVQGSRVYSATAGWAPAETASGTEPAWPVRATVAPWSGAAAGAVWDVVAPSASTAAADPVAAVLQDAFHHHPGGGTGVEDASDTDAPAGAPTGVPAGGVAALGPLRALGQAGSAWMVAESPRGVVLVDPHAAHEKVLYAELLASWDEVAGAAGTRSRDGRSQLLLIPAMVECSPEREARLAANADFIEACGFTVEPFGPGVARCLAIPAACGSVDASRLLTDLLDALDDTEAPRPVAERRHRAAALLACHSAVRLGDALAPAAQQRLLDRLASTPGSTTCPHGRPTVVLLDDAALRRVFRRPG